MSTLGKICAALLLAGAALAPLPALAGAVVLKSAPASHGAAITLGDLFDGAGSVAQEVVAPAAAPGTDAVLDAARVQVMALRAGLTWDNATGQRRIVVASVGAARVSPPAAAPPTGGRLRTAPAPAAAAAAAARRAVQALAYSRNINTGELIDASDIVWSDTATAPGDAPADTDAVLGKAARRPLRMGAAVGLHDLASPKVIKRDEIVQVLFEDGGVSLTLQAKATADASVGDVITLVNTQSKKMLEAVCTGPGKAVVGPAAEQMKSSAFDPRRFAVR